eukprot:TRINITY_DN1566_c0_g1_i6.p1 TRINITY_DN1566_c0_g1~~TRINITY_DN1566_c0_g1_i6.p1  ORF type:complete len:1401 (+),score=376.97 TRINITY_DN1566_c0_g1_i6:144-4346(+)
MIRRPPRSTHCISSAASDVYKRQVYNEYTKKKVLEFFDYMTKNEHLEIKASGLLPDELSEIVYSRLGEEVNPLRPLAIKLEGGSEKDQLTVGLEEKKLTRCWSQWYQTDPVELLLKGRVVPGKGDLACEYGGRVFLFENEENQTQFLNNPRKFLQEVPKLPQTYNVAIIGPRKSGKRTFGEKLCQEYGWKKVDIQQMITQVISEQKQQEVTGGHIPSNFEPKVNNVHLSEPEWKEFVKGKEVAQKDVWPIILHKLGVPLQKKPENWGVEKQEGAEEDEEEKKKKEEEEKKKAQKKLAQKNQKLQKEKQGGEEDDRPKSPPVEDLSLKDIIQQVQEDNKLKPVKGLLIIGQPMNEEQINILKYHNIPLDKIIVLMDKDEEEPGKNLAKHPGFDINYSVEQEMATINNAAAVLKEQYGEENVKEIDIKGSIPEVYAKIKTQLDPFYKRFDEESTIKVTADINEEEDDPLSWGEYGSFCPISMRDEGWLLPGKKEFEAMVEGRKHLFYGEKEQVKFKDHVNDYCNNSDKILSVPPPRIMVLGVRGSGVHTQLEKLHQKYKIPVLDLKTNLLQQLDNEKQKRKQDRIFNKGFKPQVLDEEGKVVEDPEINEEAQDFDRKVHEIEMAKYIFKDIQQILVNGNFFDIEEDKVATPLIELLSESKRLPEVVIILKVSEENFLKRQFNVAEVEKEYKKLMEERKLQKQKEREEARKKAQEDGEELPPEDTQNQPVEEEDPDAPNLEEMKNQKKEKLQQQRESDNSKVDEVAEGFEQLGVPKIVIEADRPSDKVFEKILFSLRGNLEMRENLLEKYQCVKPKQPLPEEGEEKPKPKRILYYEQSYVYRKSRLQTRNPLTLLDIPHSKDFPLLYRNRIFYLNSEEELLKVKSEPLKYLQIKESFPPDFNPRPQVFIIGNSQTGKSALAKLLEKQMNLVRIKISHILSEFLTDHICPLTQQAKLILQSGEVLSDDILVDLILKRTQLSDCLNQGWILDGFPKTKQQAQLFTARGIIPTQVFSLQLDTFVIKNRSVQQKKNTFGYNNIILHTKIQKQMYDNGALENYYIQNFNNVRFLNSKISKWGLLDQARESIYESLHQRQLFARSLITDEAVPVGNMSLTQEIIINNLSVFLNYSPVSIKANRLYFQNSIYNRQLVYFNRFIYVLNNWNEIKDFIHRPDLYIFQKINDVSLAKQITVGNLKESYLQAQFQGHCVGELLENYLRKSNPDILVKYKDNIYSFSSSYHKNQFLANPEKYKQVKLPDKLPVQFEKKNLVKKVAKQVECTAYLEHHLGSIVMKVLAQLGYKRLKYPTLNCKDTALKFIAISLKASNPNQSEECRQKYREKLQIFLKHCQFAESIDEENKRKNEAPEQWQSWDEENLLKITQEFADFMEVIQNQDSEDYFSKFIM